MKKYLKLTIWRGLTFDMIMFSAIQLIFLNQVRNINIEQCLLIESMFWYLQTFLQVPGALIVEKIGNKRSTVLGNILWITAICIYFLPGGITLIILAEVFRAIGLVLQGITSMPLLAKQTGEDYTKVEGNGVFCYFLIDTVLAGASGFVFKINPYLPMLGCLLISIISLTLSLQIQDAVLEKKTETKNSIKDFKLIVKNKFSIYLFAYAFCMCGVLSLPATLNKVYMQDIGIPVEWFGIILAVLSLINGLSAKYNQKIAAILKGKAVAIIATVSLIAYCILGVAYVAFKESLVIFVVIIPIFIIQNMAKQPYRIFMKKYINEKVETRLIPKTVSLYFLIESLGRAGLLLMSGILTSHFNVGLVYLLILGITIIPIIVVTKLLSSKL